jgi:hypothetical protein
VPYRFGRGRLAGLGRLFGLGWLACPRPFFIFLNFYFSFLFYLIQQLILKAPKMLNFE